MRLLISILFSLISFLLTTNSLAQDFSAQSNQDVFLDTLFDNSFNLNVGLEKQLISLDSILFLTVANHPSVKFRDALVKEREYNLQTVKRTWQQSLFGAFDYNMGNQSIILTGSQESQNISNGYRAGISFRLPLFEFFGRRSQINQAKQEIEASSEEKELSILETRQEVIQSYWDLIFAQKILLSGSENIQTQNIAMNVAESQFKKGSISVDEYSRIMNQLTIAEQQYQTNLKTFYTAYYKFEILVGVPMPQLRR